MSDRPTPTPTPDREFPRARLQQRKEQLLSQIQAEQQQGLRRPRLRRWTLAVGAAAAAVAVAVTVVALLPAGSGGPSPAAAAVLNRLARLVAAQPLAPGPGQYLYIESRNDYPAFNGTCETLAVDHRQIWIGTDGSGLLRDTTGPQQFSSAADRATCLKSDPKMRLATGRTTNDWFAPQCLSLKPANFEWSSLSSDPRILLEQMRKLDGGPTTPGEDFVHIGDFLRETDTPPAVRSTLYRAAALIPGIQLLGTVRDHDGRAGLGIAYPSQGPYPRKGSSAELIFDPTTGELTGEQGTGPSYWAVYLQQKVVNDLPGKPPAPLKPPCEPGGAGTTKTLGPPTHPDGSITTGAGLN